VQFLPDDRVTSGLSCVEFSRHLQIGEKERKVRLGNVTIVAPSSEQREHVLEQCRNLFASISVHLTAPISHQRVKDCGEVDLPG
jgi:hypothetical protein